MNFNNVPILIDYTKVIERNHICKLII